MLSLRVVLITDGGGENCPISGAKQWRLQKTILPLQNSCVQPVLLLSIVRQVPQTENFRCHEKGISYLICFFSILLSFHLAPRRWVQWTYLGGEWVMFTALPQNAKYAWLSPELWFVWWNHPYILYFSYFCPVTVSGQMDFGRLSKYFKNLKNLLAEIKRR